MSLSNITHKRMLQYLLPDESKIKSIIYSLIAFCTNFPISMEFKENILVETSAKHIVYSTVAVRNTSQVGRTIVVKGKT